VTDDDDEPEVVSPPEDDRPFDASDPEQVQKRKSRAGRDKRAKEDVVKALLETRNGRLWLRGMLTDCHIFEDCFRESSATGTAFLLGERNAGLRLLVQVQRHPNLYVAMMKEKA
jgi:hypothetical protein